MLEPREFVDTLDLDFIDAEDEDPADLLIEFASLQKKIRHARGHCFICPFTNMDPYQSLDTWKQALRQTCIAYCNADDAVKDLNKELKPLCNTVRECSQKVVALLQQRDEKRCDIADLDVSLKLDCRKSKKMPSKPQLRDRCIEFCEGDDDKGDRLFSFLMDPICTERTRLLRKKLPGSSKAPVFTDAVNDLLEEMELHSPE